jgi:hypothetical protein
MGEGKGVHQQLIILKKSYGKNGKFLNMLDPLGYTTMNSLPRLPQKKLNVMPLLS